MDCNWEDELCNGCAKNHEDHSLFTHIKRENNNFEALSLKDNNLFTGTLLTNGTCKGTIKYKNGDIYEGEFKGNKKDGQGSMRYAPKELTPNEQTLPVYLLSYEGSWKNDLYEGEGTLTWSNFITYKGAWLKGLRHGKGRESYVYGEMEEGYYEGRWYLGKRHGCGLMSFPIGRSSVREYLGGELIQSIPIMEGSSSVFEIHDIHSNTKEKEAEIWRKRKALEDEIELERLEMKLLKEQTALEIQKQKVEIEQQKINVLSQLESTKTKMLSEIESVKKQFEIEKNTFEENKKRIKNLNSKSSNIVKINAGGTLFTTSVSTLTKYDSFFKEMFSGDYEIDKMEDGSIFLDVAPEIFSFIIAFLRNPVFYPPEDAKDRERLRVVAESYGMKEISDYITKYK
jgi:hypothetical protein